MRTLFFSAVSASCLILVSCGSEPVGNNPQGISPTVAESIAKAPEKFQNDPTFRSCFARSVDSCSLETAKALAKNGDTADSCDVFSDDALKKSCVNAVTLEIARKKGDPKLCDSLTDTKSACVAFATTAKAVAEKNPALCRGIPEIPSAPKSEGGVPKIANGRDACVSQAAIGLGRAGIRYCSSIKNPQMKNACITGTR